MLRLPDYDYQSDEPQYVSVQYKKRNEKVKFDFPCCMQSCEKALSDARECLSRATASFQARLPKARGRPDLLQALVCDDLAENAACQHLLSRCESPEWRRRVMLQLATEHETRFPGKVAVDDCPAMVHGGFALKGQEGTTILLLPLLPLLLLLLL